jgi:hypothetical protein
MTAALFSPESYAQNADLLPGADLPNLKTADAGEARREDLLITKLGLRGWVRLHHFRNYYSQGWGERGRGRPLSPRSLEAFFRFLEAMPAPRRNFPSLFLTDAGHLELCWTDENGARVQLEFTPSQTEYYLEAGEREGAFAHNAIADLSGFLPSP